MTLIVTDANGRKYKPTGCFREPKHGEFYWSFHNSQVEKSSDTHTDHSLWGFHRIIVEPLPVEYVAHVRLTQEEFERVREQGGFSLALIYKIKEQIHSGDYDEVTP